MNSFQAAVCKALTLCASFSLAAQPVAAQAAAPHTPHAAAAQQHHHARGHKPGVHKPSAKKPDDSAPTMTLRFFNVHTNESLTLTRHAGEPLDARAEWFMRDYRRGTEIKMDPRLFDLLGRLQTSIVKAHPKLAVTFQVVSSYRTPATNEALREAGGTQAEHSQHMLGKAMDIRVSGISTAELRNLATCLKGGGVGFYAEDKFVHVDVGRVRYWPSHDYLAALPCSKPKATLLAARNVPPGPG